MLFNDNDIKSERVSLSQYQHCMYFLDWKVWTWTSLPVCCGKRLRLAGVGGSTTSPFFTLPPATSCRSHAPQSSTPVLSCQRSLMFPSFSKAPALHHWVLRPASVTSQAARRFLGLSKNQREGSAAAQRVPVLVLTALLAKAELALQIFADRSSPSPTACVPPRTEQSPCLCFLTPGPW